MYTQWILKVYSSWERMERFPTECCKTKTKVILTADQKKGECHNKLTRIWGENEHIGWREGKGERPRKWFIRFSPLVRSPPRVVFLNIESFFRERLWDNRSDKPHNSSVKSKWPLSISCKFLFFTAYPICCSEVNPAPHWMRCSKLLPVAFILETSSQIPVFINLKKITTKKIKVSQ